MSEPTAHRRARLLGVLGGMGPLATTDFMKKVIQHTGARRDQHHIPMVVFSDPGVPDRTEAICGGGPDPWPLLLQGARKLASAGVDLVAMPCNTAHHWFDRLAAAVPMRWLHIADAAGAEIGRLPTEQRRVGLLATSGTIASGVYFKRLAPLRIQWYLPSAIEQQSLVDASMRAIKSGDIARGSQLLAAIEQRLVERGATTVVLACTEFPLALAEISPPHGAMRIDATDLLARSCVTAFGSSVEPAEAPTR